MTLCAFCRNDNATNEHPYEGASDFVFYMCDDCDKRYLEHKQLGPKYLICKCDPENPRELDLSMAQSEIKQQVSKPIIIKKDDNVEEITKEYVRKVSKKQKRSFPTRY